MKRLSWATLADGRVWRLKQGRHFTAEPRAFEVEVRAAATEMGNAVRTMRDELGRFRDYNYLWLQFADSEVVLGEPCPCGNSELFRDHAYYGRCPACGRSLIFRIEKSGVSAEQAARAAQDAAAFGGRDTDQEPDAVPRFVSEPESEPEPEPELEPAEDPLEVFSDPLEARAEGRRAPSLPKRNRRRLDGYREVNIQLEERGRTAERWRGHGLDPKGRRVLLLVEYFLDEHGDRIPDADHPGDFRYRLSARRVAASARVIDVDEPGAGPPRKR